MSRPIQEVIVELIAAHSTISALTALSALGQLLIALRGAQSGTTTGLARLVTWSTAIGGTTMAMAISVYEPIGAMTPAPEVSIYAYLLVYSLGPILIASAATTLEGILLLIRAARGASGQAG